MLIFLSLKKCPNFFFILMLLTMFFFCLYLYHNNKKLKERVTKLEEETKEILERKITKELPSDLVKITTISSNIEEKEEIIKINQDKELKTDNPQIKEQSIDIMSTKENKRKPENSSYSNIYTLNNIVESTSDYTEENIEQSLKEPEVDVNEFINQPNLEETLNFYEFIQSDIKRNSPKKDKEKNINYLEELSSRIEAEIKPQTVELTEYEKNQEEQAVISYQELLLLKDKLENPNEKDENNIFIDELKKFRNYLS